MIASKGLVVCLPRMVFQFPFRSERTAALRTGDDVVVIILKQLGLVLN